LFLGAVAAVAALIAAFRGRTALSHDPTLAAE
jgi:hypothetical protein